MSMSQTYSTKNLFVTNSKTSSTLHGIVESDSLKSFKLQSTSLFNNNDHSKNSKKHNKLGGATGDDSREFIGKLIEFKCSNDSKNSILFDCCKYGSINILSYLIKKCKKCDIRLLRKLLCLISKPQSNSLLMACAIPIIKQTKDITLNKLLCLNLLLNTMVDILNVKKFQEIVNHTNYHDMHFVSLSSKYNDINSLKLIFYYCNKKCVKTNIIDKRFIMEKEENEENDSKQCKKFKNGLYFAKINKDIEMERYLRNIFNDNTAHVSILIENMVDCLISQSNRSATFPPCRSLKNRINSNNDSNSNNSSNKSSEISVFLPTTILQSGKTNSVVDNHHRDCKNQNRAKNKKQRKQNKIKIKIKNKKEHNTTCIVASATSPTVSPVLNVDTFDDENNVTTITTKTQEQDKEEVITIESDHNNDNGKMITSTSNHNSTLSACHQNNNETTITVIPKPKLPPKYRIFSFKLGEIKEIDTNIMLFLSYKDGLNFIQTNKYFNKWINDTLYDYFIFDSIKSSLYVIPARAQSIKKKIENNKHDKENGSHLFISRCIKNKKFDQFIYILEKNEFRERHDESTINQFMNRFEERCKQFFICRDLAKKYRNGQMFIRQINLHEDEHREEYMEISARWQLQNNSQSDNNIGTTASTTITTCGEYIKRFLKYMNDIIKNITKWDKRLFSNESNHWRAIKKIDKYYNDFFDAFYYLSWYSGDANEVAKYTADATFRLHESQWRYFEESIATWLLVVFMDKLPLTRKFIGSFNKENKKYCGDKYHTDFGGYSFLEFFLQLKTHMVNDQSFLRWCNYFDSMYEENDEELDFAFDYLLPVALFRQMESVYYHMYTGAFRLNFILSSFFLTNSKRLRNRSTFVKSLFMHKTDKLYNKIGNAGAENDCTLNRLTYLFLKDIRPFGTIKRQKTNGVNVCREFNFAPWVEFYSMVQCYTPKPIPFDLNKVGDTLLDARKKASLRYNKAEEVDDPAFEDELYRHCQWLFQRKKCGQSCNLNYENMKNKVFVSNINSLIKQLQKQKK